MNKFLSVALIWGACVFNAAAQKEATVPAAMPFGKVDNADLTMTSCDFEKDANAEILFDIGKIGPEYGFIVTERHVRIKIFNEKGKNEGSIRILFWGGREFEVMSTLEAETINLENGKQVITKVDKKSFFTEAIDAQRSAVSFAFPNVKPGSVIEYKYKLTSKDLIAFPTWYFQNYLPTRYSELTTNMINELNYKRLTKVYQPYARQEGGVLELDQIRGIAYVPSLPREPYSGSWRDNLERVEFQFNAIGSPGVRKLNLDISWPRIAEMASLNNSFGGQFSRGLAGEDSVIQKAKGLKSVDDKIAYIFNTVKNTMKWNDLDLNFTIDGTVKAWSTKTGNSTEVNLILYHLLKKAGVGAVPMVVSTKEYGRIDPAYPNLRQLNKTVVYVAIDSTKEYVLDATGKYNLYNEIPVDLLNSYGFCIEKDYDKSYLVLIQKELPAMQSVFVNAEIKPDGKMNGSTEITSYSYNRINSVKRYKTDGEKKYIDFLRNDNNDLKISGLKLENMEVDTLPLSQKYNFTLDLAGSDETNIYFNPNLLTGFEKNPFLSEVRKTNIDFGYRNNYSINGIYKLPAGYKVDAMPRNITMAMSDTGITFKRTIIEQEGVISVRYVINYRKTQFDKENYPEILEFYRKMYELLNEQIVLKKS